MADTITVKSGKHEAAYSSHRSLSIKGIHLPLMNYKQQDSYSCGYMAALTIARYYKPSVSDEAVLDAIKTGADTGTSQKKMISGLKKLGIKAVYRDDLSVNHLRFYVSRRVPVIISVLPDEWDGDHWTVVRGFSDKGVHLTNHYTLSLEDFWTEWVENWGEDDVSGAGLICTLT